MVLETEKLIKPFLDIPYPKYDWCHAVADMEYESLEEIKKRFKCPKTWNSISLDDMLHFKDFIFFIPDDKEKIYYFPTYIKYLVENPKEIEGTGLDYTFCMALKDINLSSLTEEQKEALINFIVYLKSNNKKYEYNEELLEECIKQLSQ